MEPHYHAWLRAGRVFTMSSKRWNDRTAAHRWAAARRPDKADRLVLACTDCPTSRPSRRRPRWPAIARSMAAALGVPLPAVREALAAARDGEGADQALAAARDGEGADQAVSSP